MSAGEDKGDMRRRGCGEEGMSFMKVGRVKIRDVEK